MTPNLPLEYTLIDAGDGEKLEMLGGVAIVRPAPAAIGAKRSPSRWNEVSARFEAKLGWTLNAPLPEPWIARAHELVFQLEPTPSGQIGWFPEKSALVDELAALVKRASSARGGAEGAPRVLHLFAYTGVATLALARAGAAVTHVDAARSVLAWARRNAALNALESRPIRWIAEDAARWVQREIRRGARYDAILLDPPSFGRAAGARAFKLDRDLDPLLAGCVTLLSESPLFLVVTSHTQGRSAEELGSSLSRASAKLGGNAQHDTLVLRAESGAALSAGIVARQIFAE